MLDDAATGVSIGFMTLGLIRGGHIGGQIARLAAAHGYAVVISNSRGPDTSSALVAEVEPNARAATAIEAAQAGELPATGRPHSGTRRQDDGRTCQGASCS